MSYTQIIYHIIFRTHRSERTIIPQIKKELYACIWDIVKQQNCMLYRIGGVEDHVHLLISLHPTVSLSRFIQKVKGGGSSHWMMQQNVYWVGWGEGYCALTYNYSEKETIINYINSQEERHKRNSWQEEIEILLRNNGIEFDERFI